MDDLLKQLNEKNITYIETNNEIDDSSLKSKFIRILRENNLQKRNQLWSEFEINVKSLKQVPELANPFFIGFGNPKARILFIGKEKAFDISNSPHLLFQESINNVLHWQLIADGKDSGLLNFDPRNPRTYHTQKIKQQHTWGKYAKILAELIKELTLKELLKDNNNSTQNLFDHCFLTELNHLPSRYSKTTKIISERKEFLKNDFYKSFEFVLIGAKPYLCQDEIEEIFNATLLEKDIKLGKRGKIRISNITCDVYKSKSQFIIYCQQLSGGSGWTNEALLNLCVLIKNSNN